ncbi:capsule assembly Wzi family protein [Trichlorobacter lovleyi]|uniref:Capsule assembly Wzi family protein n=1 Tax=Trichlorobacter lovleyi (strain ATCC BAA-1151 / DSM 17278 / SZ) TaxID=398767 RepID=B3E8W2_TRIL1|nr:capsule assembly Wzi family protein [Trichlorobacter lovleyi]ACD95230.1 conserved hypothetical protein [Trichlorobacter lovleyi SZ]
MNTLYKAIIVSVLLGMTAPALADMLSSSNIPLDSPIYLYLEKLSGMGLIRSDSRGLKPFSRAEAARLTVEATETYRSSASHGDASAAVAKAMLKELKSQLARELALYNNDTRARLFDATPVLSARLRYVYLDGTPRSYERQANDPGNDGVFGIGQGLRPRNPYPSPVQHHGSEGTPLLENNEGTVYSRGHNAEFRVAGEAYISRYAVGLFEPQLLYGSERHRSVATLNRAYVKLGGGALELEVGRDSTWMGLGQRGAITLSNNARNLDMLKLSSPEPFTVSWLSWLGDMKYMFLVSRLDHTVTNGKERQPYYYAVKLISKPSDNLEIGFNLGKQAGGTGLNNSLQQYVNGILGGTSADNSNGMAGFELRYRAPWLRNTEFYAEFSGEDTASFWPIVESYLAGFYIPMLTSDGRNDLRFEYFRGNNILYTSSTMPQGYLYHDLPLGHAQGGATEDFFVRYSHWLGVKNNIALDYSYTTRGNFGGLPGQAVEQKHAGRVSVTVPLFERIEAQLLYGVEGIRNVNLVLGQHRTNQLMKLELRYNY